MKYGLVALALVIIAGIAYAMSLAPASFKQNVKMTVTVATPEGDVSGSVVREISNAAPMVKMNWPHGGNPATVRGEAVVIDLGKRGVLFALINENAEAQRFYRAFPPPDRHPQSDDTFRYYAQLPIGTSAILDQENWPRFVSFTNANKEKK